VKTFTPGKPLGIAWNISTSPAIGLLGVDLQALGFSEEIGFRKVDKIRHWTKPLLVIHTENDQIIPFAEGLELYDACPTQEKTLLKVAGAGHNDILSVSFKAYKEAVTRFRYTAKPQQIEIANICCPLRHAEHEFHHSLSKCFLSPLPSV
jgi:hypothetical protein